MKIGEELVHQGETMARLDENVGRGAAGKDCSRSCAGSGGFLGSVLKRPDNRGADSKNLTALPQPRRWPNRGLGDFVSLAVHPVVVQVLGVNGLKGPQANLQGDVESIPRASAQRCDFRGEMQTRRGSSHGSGPAAKTVW